MRGILRVSAAGEGQNMHRVKSLPEDLLLRYRDWKEHRFPSDRDLFRKLAIEGQNPDTMVIACCDSRVGVNTIFGQRAGELFVHRNIANLVPPYVQDGRYQATAAAIEFAVLHLQVAHLVVMGHSGCGGVRGCLEMCQGSGDVFTRPDSFMGPWLELLRPAHDRIVGLTDPAVLPTAMEKEAVQLSLENLMGYPFVAEAVDADRLTLHGLWVDLAEMEMEAFDGRIRHFVPS
jgi:carbonic anhydrase